MQKATFSHCVNTLLDGGVVALPTETVYGLACLALDSNAVDKVFRLKKRPPSNPLIVHVLNLEHATEISYPNTVCKLLCRKFWPGPLTLIIPKKKIVPENVTAGLETVAIRSPSHPLFRKVLESTGMPIAAPSANPYSTISPTSAIEVMNSLEILARLFWTEENVILDWNPRFWTLLAKRRRFLDRARYPRMNWKRFWEDKSLTQAKTTNLDPPVNRQVFRPSTTHPKPPYASTQAYNHY